MTDLITILNIKRNQASEFMATLPESEVAVERHPVTGKYWVFHTGYTARIARKMGFTRVQYDSTTETFQRAIIPNDELEENKQFRDEEGIEEDTYDCCAKYDDFDQVCPRKNIICIVDTLWGSGIYVPLKYFSKSIPDQVQISNDLHMLLESGAPLSGTVIFEQANIDGELQDQNIAAVYQVLKDLEYCAMFDIVDIEVVTVTSTDRGESFKYINVNSESG